VTHYLYWKEVIEIQDNTFILCLYNCCVGNINVYVVVRTYSVHCR